MNILQKSNKKLRMVSKEIQEVSQDIKLLAHKLNRTMRLSNGVGIAAPQIGELIRLIIVKTGNDSLFMINPVITERSNTRSFSEEGCLSVQGVKKQIMRHDFVTVEFTDLDNRRVSIGLSKMSSRIAQHEIDHLNGILFIDYDNKGKLK